jgi:hypothetical protein
MLISDIEVFSPEDSLMYGGDRDFIPTRRMFLVTVDQTLQDNHGYTGDVNPVSYSRIAERKLSFHNTGFPNRTLG